MQPTPRCALCLSASSKRPLVSGTSMAPRARFCWTRIVNHFQGEGLGGMQAEFYHQCKLEGSKYPSHHTSDTNRPKSPDLLLATKHRWLPRHVQKIGKWDPLFHLPHETKRDTLPKLPVNGKWLPSSFGCCSPLCKKFTSLWVRCQTLDFPKSFSLRSNPIAIK